MTIIHGKIMETLYKLQENYPQYLDKKFLFSEIKVL